MLGIIGAIIVGGIIGWLASILAKTNDQMGCLWNIVIGILGAALGSWLARSIFEIEPHSTFSLTGFLIGVGGAVVLILLLRGIGILRRDR